MPQRETRMVCPAAQAGQHPGACNTWLVGVPAGVLSRAPWPEVLGGVSSGTWVQLTSFRAWWDM